MPSSLRKLLFATAASALGALTLSATAGAASFTVNSTADAALSNSSGTACVSTHESKCTLRAAVQAADNTGGASTITLPAGEYKLTIPYSSEPGATGSLDVKGSTTSLTVTGAGAAETIIAAGELGEGAWRVDSGEDLSISGVTVENGTVDYGGAFHNEGSLTVTDSVLRDNHAPDGGGAIESEEPAQSTTVVGSTLEGNTSYEGGAITAYAGSVALTEDTIDANEASGPGGAISVYESTPQLVEVTGSTISKNQSESAGGGLHVHGDSLAGELIVHDSTFAEDLAGFEQRGGAIDDEDFASVEVRGSEFVKDETEAGFGGAIALVGDESDNESETVSESTFDDDRESFQGGAIYAHEAGSLSVSDSTFDGDDAGEGGGAIITFATDAGVTGSSFQDDSATAGSGGALYLSPFSGEEPQQITSDSFNEDSATGDGGAIYDEYGVQAISASTFFRDSAGGEGGAFFQQPDEGFSLTNDTFERNHATRGGALGLHSYEEQPETASRLLNDTIVRNEAETGGGMALTGGSTYAYDAIKNTIVAENLGGDCAGAGVSDNTESADEGGNIDGDGSCFSDGVTDDHTGVLEPSLKVAVLGDNGGPTETDKLLEGSPAIAGGVPETCPETDERGLSRVGQPCDSGAYQVGELTTTTTTTTSSSTTTTRTATQPVTQKPCRSTRSEAIHWKVRKGVALKRIIVTLDGRTYRTLAGTARSVDVSLAGLAKRTVTVRITGVSSSGARYRTARVFHTCVPAKSGAGSVSDYLRRAAGAA